MRVVKKYGNRRLYDTGESRYITLEELAEKVRADGKVRVEDAKTGEDLTQATLAQVVLESRDVARLMPVPLLLQLIRMGDGAFAEFFGQFLGTALDAYLQAQERARAAVGFGAPGAPALAPASVAPAPPGLATAAEVAELRRELTEIRQALQLQRDRGS